VDVVRPPRPVALASYRIERLLGRGGMGEVYLAEDLRLKRRVALKVLSAEFANDEAFRERFLVESELAASLDHPNVIPIYEADEAAGYLFIAMRYVDGTDLKERLRQGPLAPEDAIDLLSQVASALDMAHERGLVHRDVKPSNVLVAPGAGVDGKDHAYLADFGLTRRLTDAGSLSDDGQLMGTVDYVAPEQIEGGEIDGRTDLYSLGCLLVECLTGEPPFEGRSDIEILFAHLEADPPVVSRRRPEFPSAIDAVVAKALAKEPTDRQGSCQALVTDTRKALGLAETPRRRRLRTPLLAAAVILSLLAVWFGSTLIDSAEAKPLDTLLRIDPATNRVVQSIDVGDRASSVAIGNGYLWVTSLAERALWRIDPSTGDSRVTPVDGTPMDVVVRDGTAVVATGPFEMNVNRVDVRSGKVIDTIPLKGAEGAFSAVAAGGAGVWVAACGYGGGNVARLTEDTTTQVIGGETTILNHVPIFSEDPNWVFGHTPNYPAYTDVAVGERSVWLTLDSGPAIRRVDPTGRRGVEVIDIPFLPRSITVGDGAVWITGLVSDVLARLDPETEAVTMMVPVGRGADGVAVADGDAWVADSIDGTVTRVDAQTGRVLATIAVEGQPEDLVVGAGGVWVTTHTS
jgi:serine/threonine protein kinase